MQAVKHAYSFIHHCMNESSNIPSLIHKYLLKLLLRTTTHIEVTGSPLNNTKASVKIFNNG